MTFGEFLSRVTSEELTEQMAYDTLEAEGLKALAAPQSPARPMPARAARSIRLDDPNIFDKLDRYWPPVGS